MNGWDIPLQLVSCLAYLVISSPSRYSTRRRLIQETRYVLYSLCSVVLVWNRKTERDFGFEINLQASAGGIVILHQVGQESAERLLKTETKAVLRCRVGFSTEKQEGENMGEKEKEEEKTHPLGASRSPLSQTTDDWRRERGNFTDFQKLYIREGCFI